MAAKKRKASDGWAATAAAADDSSMDWFATQRRPFRRGFIPYGIDEEEMTTALAAKRRKGLGIAVIQDAAGVEHTPAPLDSFEGVGVLPPWLLEALRDRECFEPTPLQAQALPIVLAGQNFIALAKGILSTAGCGAAAASYLLPAAVHVDDQPPLTEEDPGPVVLVLTASPEFAGSVSAEATELLVHSGRSARHDGGLRVVNVSGGGTRNEKLQQLSAKGAHIMVGTPKRVLDMAWKEQISLLRVTMLVLHGADRILEMGWGEDVRTLASWIRPERQTLLLAATWPKTMLDLAKDLCFAGGPAVQISTEGNATPLWPVAKPPPAVEKPPAVVEAVAAPAKEAKESGKVARAKAALARVAAAHAAGNSSTKHAPAKEAKQSAKSGAKPAAKGTVEESLDEWPPEWG